jgi:hypothetical protein
VPRPWEEPGAGKPQARICEGEAEWPSYSTAGQHHRALVRLRVKKPQSRKEMPMRYALLVYNKPNSHEG